MLPQHIWFVSHHQWTLFHGNTHGNSLNLNYSPHSIPPSVHLLLLLSLTHRQSKRNVYQVCEAAGCPLTNRSDAELSRHCYSFHHYIIITCSSDVHYASWKGLHAKPMPGIDLTSYCGSELCGFEYCLMHTTF